MSTNSLVNNIVEKIHDHLIKNCKLKFYIFYI